MELTNKQISDLRDIHRVSGLHGTWDYDSYTQGLYNGLEMALAIIENRDPEFKKRPGRFISDPEPMIIQEQIPDAKMFFPDTGPAELIERSDKYMAPNDTLKNFRINEGNE